MKQPRQNDLGFVIRHQENQPLITLSAIVCAYNEVDKILTVFVFDHIEGRTYFLKTTQGYEDSQFCYSGEYGL